jgi:hypothetical protein
MPIEATIIRLKREYPGWGAPKIREKLRQRCPAVLLPAISTVHAVLDRHGLVRRRRRRRAATTGTTLSRRVRRCENCGQPEQEAVAGLCGCLIRLLDRAFHLMRITQFRFRLMPPFCPSSPPLGASEGQEQGNADSRSGRRAQCGRYELYAFQEDSPPFRATYRLKQTTRVSVIS